MTGRILQDHGRFRDLVKRRFRSSLRRYASQIYRYVEKNGQTISIPIYNLDIPHFTFNPTNTGGVGQGDGDITDNLGAEQSKVVPFTLEEVAQILGEELSLPNLEEKMGGQTEVESERYTSISRQGPRSLRHFKRTFIEAMKRQIASGEYDLEDPIVVPRRVDERFRASSIKVKHSTNVVIIDLKDASGSMMEDEVYNYTKNTSILSHTWIKGKYPKAEEVYIDYDTIARLVTREQFFSSGGKGMTNLKTGLEKVVEVIDTKFPAPYWNVYVIHYEDGDFAAEQRRMDEEVRSYLLREFLPRVSGYFVHEFITGGSPSPSAKYSNFLHSIHLMPEGKKIRLAVTPSQRLFTIDVIRTFFGKSEEWFFSKGS